MNGAMEESVIVKEYEFDKPSFQEIVTLIDNSIRDCHNKFFHIFDHICEYDIKLTNITNNELFNIAISDKSMELFEVKKK